MILGVALVALAAVLYWFAQPRPTPPTALQGVIVIRSLEGCEAPAATLQVVAQNATSRDLENLSLEFGLGAGGEVRTAQASVIRWLRGETRRIEVDRPDVPDADACFVKFFEGAQAQPITAIFRR